MTEANKELLGEMFDGIELAQMSLYDEDLEKEFGKSNDEGYHPLAVISKHLQDALEEISKLIKPTT